MSRPGQFWRLTRGPGDWARGGIHKLLAFNQACGVLTAQPWTTLPTGPGRPRSITRIGQPLTISYTDFTARCTHRLFVLLARCQAKGMVRADFPDTPAPMGSPRLSWMNPLRPLLASAPAWSIYTDARWRAVHPIQAQALLNFKALIPVGERSSFRPTSRTGAPLYSPSASISLRPSRPSEAPHK